MNDVTRRQMMGGLAVGAAAAAIGTAEAAMKPLDNDTFYKADGSFDVDAAKEAYYEMMRYHNYPIPERLRGEDFWTLDFGAGNFLEVGMAGIFWINRKEDDYFGHDIYLFPGQMIPEHKHVKTADARAKMEGWHVRHGSVHIYGEGEPTPGVAERIPPMHREIATARTEQKLMPGEVGWLGGPEEWHFMVGGPEGAIVTEYASYQDGTALRFSHPDVSF